MLERAKSSILPNGNFREFFLWGGGILRFQNGNSQWPWMQSARKTGARIWRQIYGAGFWRQFLERVYEATKPALSRFLNAL